MIMRSMDLFALAEEFSENVGFSSQFRHYYLRIRMAESVRNSVFLAIDQLGLSEHFRCYLDRLPVSE
jgi:hypothetical protein